MPCEESWRKRSSRVHRSSTDRAGKHRLRSGQERGRIKVSEEPEGVGVNPITGQVYVRCEEKGEVYVILPIEQKTLDAIQVGGRPRSVAFLPDGSRAYVACETGGYVSGIDAG